MSRLSRQSTPVPGIRVLLAALIALGGPPARAQAGSPEASPPGADADADEASGVLRLPPVITEGTAADVLLLDPVVPARGGRPLLDAGSGSVDRSLLNTLAAPLVSLGPGELSSFRGFGKSAEDTNVQALGIPLNGPQGGGLDLSVFPQFLWTDFRWQPGPSFGAFDPRGVAGTLTLVPWTQAAIASEGLGLPRARVSTLVAGAQVQQAAAAVSAGSAALVAGYTEGRARGPSGALSARLTDRDARTQLRFHLLGTRWDAEVPGSRSFPSPNARQLTGRLIPVAQLDVRLDELTLWKSNVYFDWTHLRAENPGSADPLDSPYLTVDRVRQLGTESVLVFGAWQLGGGARVTRYRKLDFEAPEEVAGNLRLSRTFEAGPWLVEPLVQAVAVSQFGARGAGSLGVRYEGAGDWAAYSRVSRAHRFPSLVDRFYAMPPFAAANPELQPERSWTWVPGAEWKGRDWRAGLEGYAQFSDDAQVGVLDGATRVVRNVGRARVLTLTPSLRWEWGGGFFTEQAVTVTGSRIEASDQPFPFLSRFVYAARLGLARAHGDLTLALRHSSRASVGAQSIRPYEYVDLGGRYRLFRPRSEPARGGIWVQARIENLLNQAIELFPDYPLPGRTLTVSLVGDF